MEPINDDFSLILESGIIPRKKQPHEKRKIVESETHYKPDFDVVQFFKIAPHYSATYNRILYHTPPDRAYSLPKNNRAIGIFSRHSRTRLVSSINWMLFLSQRKWVWSKSDHKGFYFKVNFITLTLSDVQSHTDTYIVTHMLQPFLKWIARSHNAWNYVWKAEAQDNGNIHFHITTNKFIHLSEIRKKWNSLQLKHGYMSRYNAGNKDCNPNSTDVHAVKNETELAMYMGKYFSKNDVPAKEITCFKWQKHVYEDYNDQYTCNIETGNTELIKRRVTCKLWSSNTALMKTNCTIHEREKTYWEARREWLEDYCTETKELEYISIHFQKTANHYATYPVIADKIIEIEKLFNARDDGKTKYEIESFSSN